VPTPFPENPSAKSPGFPIPKGGIAEDILGRKEEQLKKRPEFMATQAQCQLQRVSPNKTCFPQWSPPFHPTPWTCLQETATGEAHDHFQAMTIPVGEACKCGNEGHG